MAPFSCEESPECKEGPYLLQTSFSSRYRIEAGGAVLVGLHLVSLTEAPGTIDDILLPAILLIIAHGLGYGGTLRPPEGDIRAQSPVSLSGLQSLSGRSAGVTAGSQGQWMATRRENY